MLAQARRRKPTESGTERRPPPAYLRRHVEVRVKRWGKSPPATAATRRLAKPHPVQGEQGPPTQPAEGPGSCREGWSPPTESGLQACYRKTPQMRGFPIFRSAPVHHPCITVTTA